MKLWEIPLLILLVISAIIMSPYILFEHIYKHVFGVYKGERRARELAAEIAQRTKDRQEMYLYTGLHK
jgi:hypothetical protein